eukprot:4007315-Alexandrium_andersonii.AAC.1
MNGLVGAVCAHASEWPHPGGVRGDPRLGDLPAAHRRGRDRRAALGQWSLRTRSSCGQGHGVPSVARGTTGCGGVG